MRIQLLTAAALAFGAVFAVPHPHRQPQGKEPLPRAFIDGTAPGWTPLTLQNFVNVNGEADTWTEQNGVITCTGKPNGGARSQQQYTNFELVMEWKHHEHGGNSGLFVWCPESAFTDLPKGTLPRSGIEVQILDPGYEQNWLKSKGKRSDWFTSHGDVFPVGGSKMHAEAPQNEQTENGETWRVGKPDSPRSFPSRRLVRPAGQWNHYYVRAISGEIRLWVNGEEVNCGSECAPATGYLALEAEGAKIEFRNIRLRILP